METIMDYHVKITRDSKAGVWIAESDDLKGLILEEETLEALLAEIKIAAEELIGLNNLEKATRIFCQPQQFQLEFADGRL